MGTIKQGILGGFSGKVGTVIGGSWKGISYMRSIPQSVHNPKTEKQTAQRSKFTVAVQALKPLNEILKITWKENISQKSPFNAAMSYTLKNAVIQQGGNYVIDYANFYISRGNFTSVTDATAVPVDSIANFRWTDNSGTANAKSGDRAVAVIINERTGEIITNDDDATRAIGATDINIPASWSGNAMRPYLAFISEDGTASSNSIYLS